MYVYLFTTEFAIKAYNTCMTQTEKVMFEEKLKENKIDLLNYQPNIFNLFFIINVYLSNNILIYIFIHVYICMWPRFLGCHMYFSAMFFLLPGTKYSRWP